MIGTLLLLVAAVSSQDTHYCPDGWIVSEIGDKVECIMLSGLKEKVTKADAAAISGFHEGWLVDMDEGWGSQKNNLLKSMIVDKEGEIGHHGGPGMQWEDQWWIGATVSGRHGDHNWGNWTWDHTGGEIKWYDWISQNCRGRTSGGLELLCLADMEIITGATGHGITQVARLNGMTGSARTAVGGPVVDWSYCVWQTWRS